MRGTKNHSHWPTEGVPSGIIEKRMFWKKAVMQKAPEASPGLFQSLVMLSGCVIDCIILILLKPSSKKAVAQKKAPEASPGRNVRPSVGLAFTCFHHAFRCHTLYYNMYCVAILLLWPLACNCHHLLPCTCKTIYMYWFAFHRVADSMRYVAIMAYMFLCHYIMWLPFFAIPSLPAIALPCIHAYYIYKPATLWADCKIGLKSKLSLWENAVTWCSLTRPCISDSDSLLADQTQ